MLDYLSEELLLEIIYFLQCDNTQPRAISRIFYPDSNAAFGASNPLASLSFTSQKLRRIVLPALFENFVISFNETHRDSDLSVSREMEAGLRAFKSASATLVKSVQIIIDEASSETHPYLRRLSPECEEFFIGMVKALPNLQEISFLDEESPNLTRKIVATINEHPEFQCLHVNESVFTDDDFTIDDLSLRKIHCRNVLISKESSLAERQLSWFHTYGASVTTLIIRPLSQPQWINCTFSGLQKLQFEQCFAFSDADAFISRHPLLTSIDVLRAPFPRSAQGQAEIHAMPWLQPYMQSLNASEIPLDVSVSSIVFHRPNFLEAWRCVSITTVLKTISTTWPESAIQAIATTCQAFPNLSSLNVYLASPTLSLKVPLKLILQQRVWGVDLESIHLRGIEIQDESRKAFSYELASMLPRLLSVMWPNKGGWGQMRYDVRSQTEHKVVGFRRSIDQT